ncbi:MAG: hypothetical protein KBT48_04170 [Firmicutes bacterium]|nr:hypothetical protein [Bacillota bacterium]
MKRSNILVKLGIALVCAFANVLYTMPVLANEYDGQVFDMEDADVELINELFYDGTYQEQKVLVTVGDVELVEDEDYEVINNIVKDVRVYRLRVRGINGNTGEQVVEFEMKEAAKDISKANVKLVNQLVAYDADNTQKVEVTYNGKTLEENVDYILSDNVAVNAGNYELTIQGIGSYQGIKKVNYTVDRKSIEDNDVVIQLVNQLIANGNKQIQKVKVTYGAVLLEEGIDYTLTGNSARLEGNYTLVVQGKGDFTGKQEVPYTVDKERINISKTKIKLANELTENGQNQTQKVIVTYKAKTLKEGVDYQLSRNVNRYPGTYKLVVEGIGDYEGSKEVEYSVKEKNSKQPQKEKEPEKEQEEKHTDYMGMILIGLFALAAIAGVALFIYEKVDR